MISEAKYSAVFRPPDLRSFMTSVINSSTSGGQEMSSLGLGDQVEHLNGYVLMFAGAHAHDWSPERNRRLFQ